MRSLGCGIYQGWDEGRVRSGGNARQGSRSINTVAFGTEQQVQCARPLSTRHTHGPILVVIENGLHEHTELNHNEANKALARLTLLPQDQALIRAEYQVGARTRKYRVLRLLRDVV